MGAFLSLLARKPQALWLDSHAYAARLLAGGDAPWLDTAAFVAWQRKAQGLLKPDVAVLPLAPAIDAWLGAHAPLRESMRAKSRTTYALKVLLADEPLRAHLVELARGLRAGVAGVPLALVTPTPRAWVAIAHAQAQGAQADVGDDDADSAAVYVADFLRAFGDAGIDALLLDEAVGYAPDAAGLACYQSIVNLAAHYRWDVGLHLAAGAATTLPDGWTFAVAARALPGTASGVVVDEDFWSGADAPSAASFRYARIPADAPPERVLQRLAALW
jgi:hypothetical protein